MNDPRTLRRPTRPAIIVLSIALAWPAFSAPSASAAGPSDTVWGWGDDRFGALGVGGGTVQVRPKRVLTSVTSISAGDGYSMAADEGGRAWSWGGNGDGQLGDGTRDDRGVPEFLSGLTGVTAVAAGTEHSLVLTSDGAVHAFGYNSYGALGIGTFGPAPTTPVDVVGLPPEITAISVGKDHSIALDADGVVWAWGQNSDGQLGDGLTANRSAPFSLAAAGMPPILQVQAATRGDHTIALDENGHVWTWGETEWGPTGNVVSARSTPEQVPGLENIVDVSAGAKFALAVDSAGSVWSWGYNDQGQLGDGTTVGRVEPGLATTGSGMTGAVDVCAGYAHVLARTTAGDLWSFGDNREGELGDGTLTDSPSPVPVEGLPAAGTVSCSAGDNHSLAVDTAGGLWAWGGNSDGELGDRRVESRVSPVRALGLPGIVTIAAGGNRFVGQHTLAIGANGSLWSWGDNRYGQLGDGTGISRGIPGLTDLAGTATAVAGGWYHSLAVDSAGDVWAWGTTPLASWVTAR